MKKASTALAAALCLACSVSAQPGISAQAQAAILDPVEECKDYTVAPFSTFYSSFPTVWTIASILPGDTVAQALFDKISPGIPDIPQFGDPQYTNVSATLQAYQQQHPGDPYCYWPATQCVTPKFPGIPADIVSCPGEANVWGLSLDDGPNCSHNALYNYLWDQNQKASLFYIGSSVAIWPFQAQRGLNDGHIIGVHTWSHRAMSALSNEQVFAELYYSTLMIKSVIGVQPVSWRPPFGVVDDRVRWIALQLGLRTVVWDENTFDYSASTLGTPTVEANYQAIFKNEQAGKYTTNGTIVLTHELTNQTMSIFVDEYPNIKSNFQHIEPWQVCNNVSHPYVEQQYSYPVHSQYIAGTTTLASYTATASLATTLAMVSSTGSVSTVTGRTYSGTDATLNSNAGAAIVTPTNTGSAAAAGTVSAAVVQAAVQKAGAVGSYLTAGSLVTAATLIGAAAVLL